MHLGDTSVERPARRRARPSRRPPHRARRSPARRAARSSSSAAPISTRRPPATSSAASATGRSPSPAAAAPLGGQGRPRTARTAPSTCRCRTSRAATATQHRRTAARRRRRPTMADASVLVTGDAAGERRLHRRAPQRDADRGRARPGLAFLLLLGAFRSPWLAAAVIGLNLLSVGAAYGVLVAVFQNHWAEGLLGFTSSGTSSSAGCRCSPS